MDWELRFAAFSCAWTMDPDRAIGVLNQTNCVTAAPRPGDGIAPCLEVGRLISLYARNPICHHRTASERCQKSASFRSWKHLGRKSHAD
jgi:hypothetical protein